MPVWARAMETQRRNPIIKDEKALELLEKIDYDFGKFSSAWKTLVGVAVRTEILDHAVGTFLKDAAESIIINLGAGLDNRFQRIDNGALHWYDIDIATVIALKRRYFKESSRYHFIPKSVLDFSWMDDIQDPGKPLLIIAEGLLMYFEEAELRPLFNAMVTRFPGGEMIFEMIPYAAVGMSRYHDALAKLDVEFKWSLKNSKELESWNRRIEFIKEWCILDYHRDRWNWLGICADFPLVRFCFGERIVHISFH